MKVAVLGAAGLLGHYVARQLEEDGFTVTALTRKQFDLSLFASVKRIMSDRYDWVVNCARLVKCRTQEKPSDMILVNSALPHWLEYEARRYRTRVIHLSTDCVFSGAKGHYNEDDCADPVDLYGASKLAGELQGPESLTLRLSCVGLGQGTERGLLAWLMREAREHRSVQGFTNALWNGISAAEAARVVGRVIAKGGYPMSSLYHVAGGTISKCDLLMCLRAAFHLDVEIVPIGEPILDRTLDGTRFRVSTGYLAPTWNFMAHELAEEWRSRN